MVEMVITGVAGETVTGKRAEVLTPFPASPVYSAMTE